MRPKYFCKIVAGGMFATLACVCISSPEVAKADDKTTPRMDQKKYTPHPKTRHRGLAWAHETLKRRARDDQFKAIACSANGRCGVGWAGTIYMAQRYAMFYCFQKADDCQLK
jgi:hypothetical protein